MLYFYTLFCLFYYILKYCVKHGNSILYERLKLKKRKSEDFLNRTSNLGAAAETELNQNCAIQRKRHLQKLVFFGGFWFYSYVIL